MQKINQDPGSQRKYSTTYNDYDSADEFRRSLLCIVQRIVNGPVPELLFSRNRDFMFNQFPRNSMKSFDFPRIFRWKNANLSIAIAHRFRIDDVHRRMSEVVKNWQTHMPSNHFPSEISPD